MAKDKGGRPRKEIDMETLTEAVSMQCTAEECARLLKVSSDTIDRRLKEQGYAGFAEFFEKFSQLGKASLRRAMYQSAISSGNVTMQIFLSKQWLGYADKVEEKSDQTHTYVSEEPLTPEEWANQYGKGVQDEQESVH